MKLGRADPKIYHVEELTFNPLGSGEAFKGFLFNGEGIIGSDTDFR